MCTQNAMANMDMVAFPGRTYRYLQVCPPRSLLHACMVACLHAPLWATKVRQVYQLHPNPVHTNR